MILITQPRNGRAHNEIIALQYAARELGWDVLSAPYGWRLDEDFTKQGLVGVPYGSQTFCEVISQQMNWTLRGNSFDWLTKLPEKYLKRKVEFMTLGEARQIKERKFIKPADDKCFDAKVYEPGEFNPSEIILDDYPVLVSEPVQWDLEYRFFIQPRTESIAVDPRSGGIRAWSNYIFYENVADPKFWDMTPITGLGGHTVLDFADHLTIDLYRNDIPTVPSVIDIGRIVGKGWAVIETNQAWASGLYGCDPMEALKVMAGAVG